MTQEQKELLFKDLCCRIPYGVKVKIQYYDDVCELQAIYSNGTTYATRDIEHHIETYFEECKPYLFPLESMTEEQKKELNDKLIELELKALNDEISHIEVVKFEIDYYLKNHFDYRGLIPMGLALDATDKNIY